MVNMMANPVILNDYLGPNHFKFREDNEKNYLGTA